MPQTLYQLGIDPSNPSSETLSPKAIASSEEIKVLWSSWCDLIYTITNTCKVRTIVYTGTSLNPAQQEDFTSSRSTINQALADPTCRLSFFGSAMHDGLRGYICRWRLRIFNTPAECTGLESLHQDGGTWDLLASPVGEIEMCSDNSILVTLGASVDGKGDSIASMPHIKYLGSRCATSESTERLVEFTPTQLVVNATTATALSSAGEVYTRTTDPRYPSTLGRPYAGASTFEPVPYLSETRIKKIASGGYMTAAISEDGELFLWGQSNPGTGEELGVLQRLDYDIGPAVTKETVIWGDTVQDDDVKLMNIFIDGRDARAYDVAIGSGHILIAAEDDTGGHVVFAAGCGAEGQLGVSKAVKFEKEFVELKVLKGKRIIQLAAAGWSSFIVTED